MTVENTGSFRNIVLRKAKDDEKYTYSHQVIFKDRMILELAWIYMVANLQL